MVFRMERLPKTQAVAEAWASIDGKLDAYRAEAPGSRNPGHRDGYDIEAAELIERIERRGWCLVPSDTFGGDAA